MKHYIKQISWKFRDCAIEYPQLKDRNIKITSPEDVFNMFRFLFDGEVRERFIILWLSSANKVMGWDVISEGILNSSLVHPREVFRGCCVSTCSSLICMHNHPSGNPEPSTEDISITKKLSEAGKLLDIPLYDHIIFAENTYTSFVERRLI